VQTIGNLLDGLIAEGNREKQMVLSLVSQLQSQIERHILTSGIVSYPLEPFFQFLNWPSQVNKLQGHLSCIEKVSKMDSCPAQNSLNGHF
jgi:hypothetical protein